MKKLTKETAMPAITVFVGTQYTDTLSRKHAIQELLGETRLSDQKAAATETVGLLLERVHKRTGLFQDTGSLSLALAIANAHALEKDMTERLVKTAAQNGFHGRFPELPIHLLNRQPTSEEVMLLISAYVENKGSRGESTEKKLMEFAKTYLPNEEAAGQIRRIEEFVVEFNRFDF